MPVSMLGRTITQIPLTTTAGTPLDLVAAPGAGLKVYVVTVVVTMNVAGTLKFTEGTGPTDLTGLFDVGNTGGFVITANGYDPILQTNTANSKLSIVTATGNGHGYIRYFLDA